MALLTRDVAVGYLTANYAPLATEFGLAVSQLGWQAVIDRSLREMGVAEADLPAATVDDTVTANNGTATRRDVWLALLDYYALLMFATFAALRVDVTVSGDTIQSQKARSQTAKALKDLLDPAKARAQSFGYLLEGKAVTWGYFELDYIEAPHPLLIGF